MSKFFSTRDKNASVCAREAVVKGLSPDGGLFVPETLPSLDVNTLLNCSYPEIAERILSAFFTDFSGEDIRLSCDEAYRYHFDTPEVCSVIKKGDLFFTELFHGETCAFKDIALSILPRLMVRAQKSLGIDDKILILTATSGDTGSAAMNGFKDVGGTGIITFYPYGGVSPIQRRQMVCMEGHNVTACAVKGNFDDCQSAVKKAFTNLPAMDGLRLSSANSINIARLVPQIGYYYATYISLVKRGELKNGEQLSFIVPTGNFGDILAGFYAKKMGLPIGKLVCASNANNVLTDFLNTGVYDKRREFLKTVSPSMDILISSNLERLLYYVQDDDADTVARQMRELKENGIYSVDGKVLAGIKETFEAYCCDDDITRKTIREFYGQNGYVLDPHTAVAVACAEKFKKKEPGTKCAVLSTASPFKFPSVIFDALSLPKTDDAFMMLDILSEKTGTPVPGIMNRIKNANELHTDVIEKEEIESYVLAKGKELF